jgi:hypothetical protein
MVARRWLAHPPGPVAPSPTSESGSNAPEIGDRRPHDEAFDDARGRKSLNSGDSWNGLPDGWSGESGNRSRPSETYTTKGEGEKLSLYPWDANNVNEEEKLDCYKVTKAHIRIIC